MNPKTTLTTIHSHEAPLHFTLYEESLSGRYAYSIAVYGNADGCAFAQDITENPEAAMQFLRLLQQEEVSPCHLLPILEDSLPLREKDRSST